MPDDKSDGSDKKKQKKKPWLLSHPLDEVEKKQVERINIIDDRIAEAVERGDFDNLPGTGKPLNLANDRLVPDAFRLAHRIMRDNDVLPAWIELQKEIDTRLESMRKAIKRESMMYVSMLADLRGKTDVESVKKRLAIRDRKSAAIAQLHDEIRRLNRKIQTYNLKIPQGRLSKDLLTPEQELKNLFPPVTD